MARYPEAQAKAQAELDAWVSVEDLKIPTLEDRPHLPYIDNLLWEVLRYHPVAPLGN